LRIRPWAGSLHPASTKTAANTASSGPAGGDRTEDSQCCGITA
jgi:hypothetical protein